MIDGSYHSLEKPGGPGSDMYVADLDKTGFSRKPGIAKAKLLAVQALRIRKCKDNDTDSNYENQ